MRIRRQEGYLLQKIGKTVYLLPYGQKIEIGRAHD